MRSPGVLFDVDGTLVDNSYLHTVAWWRAFRDVGEQVAMHSIHRLVGMGGDQLVPRLVGRELPEAGEARTHRYKELVGEVQAFPGAGELLKRVHELGIKVVLATSSPRDELDVSLAALDSSDAIDAMTTKDDVSDSKPAPDLIFAAIRAGDVDPERVLAVGDSVWDVEAARNAGVGCIALETGGFSQQELLGAGALHVYRDVEELRAQVLTSPIATLLPRL